MSTLIDKIKNSTPTHTGDKAWAMLYDIFTREDYVLFCSSIHGMDEITSLADTFIEIIADFEISPGEYVKVHNPLFFSHGVFPDSPSTTFYLMYYSNGHVVYIEDGSVSELIVLIEKQYLDERGIEYKDIRAFYIDAIRYYNSLPDDKRPELHLPDEYS